MPTSENKTLILKPYEPTGFEKQLQGVSLDPRMPLLPLIHKVDMVKREGRDDPTAADYFESGEIQPVLCDVFGEELVYTFVGRPAFRELRRPVCFILRPEQELLQNLFIFDTGGYFTDRYWRILDNLQDINLFRIPAESDAIRRFITLFFGDNESYFWGDPQKLRDLNPLDSIEEFGFSLLLRMLNFSKLDFDTRCRTLENILRTPIPLGKYLQGVILPESEDANPAFTAFRRRCSSSFETLFYDDEQGQAAAETCNERLDKVLFDYYLDKGYLDHGQ